MKKILTVFAVALFAINAQTETLSVTFGANADRAARYGDIDLSGNAKQNSDVAAPVITVTGLDLDGIGVNDDQIEVRFSVRATGGKLSRLAAGYRLDTGIALTFGISSAKLVFGSGKSTPIDGQFMSASGNNRAAKFTTEIAGETLVMTSSSADNNRARNIVAEFDVPVDTSTLKAPLVVKLAAKQASSKRPGTRNRTASKTAVTNVAKPPIAVVPVSFKTDTLKLPRLFCDDMILQQQMKNTFWGWAKAGERITVKASWGAEATVKTDAQGKWKLFLATPKYGTGHSLAISGRTDTIKIRNVAIGEVWLCAGQSNMGWSMGNSFEAEKEADVNLPDLRIFKSAREHWHQPLEMQRDRLSQWKPCDPDSAAETSAVSYYFAKKLHQELGVPVGIILQAFAGTPIEGWMPWDVQKEDPRAIAYKAEYDNSADRQAGSGATRETGLAAWKKELDEYNAHIDAGETMKNSVKPWSPPIITKPADLGHQYPGHQFNAMIYPVRPYGIRGAIWYQGERNSKDVPQAANYRKQLALLINYYRSSWHELSGGNTAEDFPFQFTQLPSWTPAQTEPVEGLSAPWVVNREMMRLVARDVPNTGMSVAIDTGDMVALHPKNKKPIGIRHAYLALKQTYGKDFVADGPRFKKQTIKGQQIVLEFDSVGSGMVPAKSGALDTFAIAGADRKWHWADVAIKGRNVIVSSPNVSHPLAVRYTWAMNPSQRNLLYNKEGLPASPFRTDNWPLFDPTAEIVTVKKPAKRADKTSQDWERPVMTQ
jgi:sialate O-acetylesterase